MGRDYCKAQIMRMGGMDFFPQFAPAITEAIDTLADCAQDEAHARRIVDECLSDHGFPEPADLRRIAHETRREEHRGPCPHHCIHGWIYQPRQMRDRITGKVVTFEASAPCPACRGL